MTFANSWVALSLQERAQLTDSLDSSHTSLGRQTEAASFLFVNLSPLFSLLLSKCFLFVNPRQMKAHPLHSLCGCRCANCVGQSKTWLGSMRPLLKIIALSGKQNSGENAEKWQNNHQILSLAAGEGEKREEGGIVGKYLQIVGNSYSIEAPTGPPLSGDHQSKRNNLRVCRSQASKTPQDCHSP